MTTGAIIVAAGQSSRMAGTDKVLAPLAGKPLLAWTLQAFLESSWIDAIVVAASAANLVLLADLTYDQAKVRAVVRGGARRRDSVKAGLDALPDVDYVVVHDGARPLVQEDLIARALSAARENGAALCAVPVSDTVKRADESGFVHTTVDRDRLWLAQTPQAFRRDILARAHAEVEGDATDDAAMVEHLGLPIRLVIGSTRNLKVTTPEDLELVAALVGHGQ